MNELTSQEQYKFANFLFAPENPARPDRQTLKNMTEEQRSKLKQLLAQKISYDIVNNHLQPLPETSPSNPIPSTTPGVISSICCCFFPQQNRENFDITSSEFSGKVCATLAFWRNDFLLKQHAKVELYGPVWLTVAYVIILGVAANLNEYFINSQNYKFNNDIVVQGLGINIIFQIAGPLIYGSVIKCLGGFIANDQALMLTGYSLILYLLPTLLCFIPSLYWHLTMLGIAGVLRAIFIFRNLSVKLDSKAYIMFVVILIIEGLYFYIITSSIFKNNSGYSYQSGTTQVFGQHSLALRTFHDFS